jgi:hypothetical protein
MTFLGFCWKVRRTERSRAPGPIESSMPCGGLRFAMSQKHNLNGTENRLRNLRPLDPNLAYFESILIARRSECQTRLGSGLPRRSLRGRRASASWLLLEHGLDPSLIHLDRHRSLQERYRQYKALVRSETQ